VIISYDIANDKKRTRFMKYIRKFGHRLQFSVYVIDNSNRILDNIIADIQNKFIKTFEQEDSVYIFKLSASCETLKFGYAANEDKSLMIIT